MKHDLTIGKYNSKGSRFSGKPNRGHWCLDQTPFESRNMSRSLNVLSKCSYSTLKEK